MEDLRTLNKKPKTEFSKIVVGTFFIASVLFTALSYILAFLGLNTVQELSQTIVRTCWSVSGISFLAYAGQNGIRAWSRNKWLAGKQIENSGEDGVGYYGSYSGTTDEFFTENNSLSDSRYENF